MRYLILCLFPLMFAEAWASPVTASPHQKNNSVQGDASMARLTTTQKMELCERLDKERKNGRSLPPRMKQQVAECASMNSSMANMAATMSPDTTLDS